MLTYKVYLKNLGTNSDDDKQILLIIQSLQVMGLTTKDATDAYLKLITALKERLEVEGAKKEMEGISESVNGIISVFEELIGDLGLTDTAIGKFVEGVKNAFSMFDKLKSSITTVLEKLKSVSGSKGIDLSAIMSQASAISAVIAIVVTMIKMMAAQMSKANDKAYALIDRSTRKITELYDNLIKSTGSSTALVTNQIAKIQNFPDTINSFIEPTGRLGYILCKMSNFDKLVDVCLRQK